MVRLKQDWEQRVMKVKRFELECSRLGKTSPVCQSYGSSGKKSSGCSYYSSSSLSSRGGGLAKRESGLVLLILIVSCSSSGSNQLQMNHLRPLPHFCSEERLDRLHHFPPLSDSSSFPESCPVFVSEPAPPSGNRWFCTSRRPRVAWQ